MPEAIAALGTLPISSMQTLTMADRQGRMAVVECNCEAMEVRYPKQGERFCSGDQSLLCRMSFPISDHDARQDSLAQAPGDAGTGAAGKDRYSRTFLQELLAGKHGFLCQYEPWEGMDTIWSALYCLRSGEAFFCFDNPSKAPFHKANVFSFDPLDKFRHPVL